MEAVLFQFPLNELSLWLPPWAEALPDESELKQTIYEMLLSAGESMNSLQDAFTCVEGFTHSELIHTSRISAAQAGTGTASAVIELEQSLYYRTISEQSGFEIKDDGDLMELLRSLKSVKTEYDHVHEALAQARETGYGVIMPGPEEMELEEPQIVSRGGRYSVRLKASAPAIHLFRTQVETEVSPAVGGEKASEQIVSFLLQGFDGDINRIWESNIFGKSLYDIANESLSAKIKRMPEDAQGKLQETLQRIINEGSGGLICIIL